MEKTKKRIFISIILGMTLFLLLDLFFLILNYTGISVKTNFIFGILISFIFFSLMFSITKSSSKSLKICYIIIFIISIINQLKVQVTKEPIVFTDIYFLKNVFRLLKLITTNVSLKIIICFIIIFLVYGLILYGLYRLSKKNEILLENKKARISIIIVDLILLVILFVPTNFTKKIFLQVFFKNDKFKDYSAYGTNLHYYNYYGFTTGIYGIHLNNFFSEPENYNEKELENELKKYEDIENNRILGKPNIIVIFSESFWKVDLLDEVKFDKNITPNFDKLKEEGSLVNLISPVYGGLSENTAFELLTGGSNNYFPQGYVPITSLYNRKNSEKIPSLVHVLKDNGYKTKTTFVEDFYSSEKSYKKMGFDEYVELIEDNKENYYDNDKVLMGEIENDLINSLSEKNFLVYSTYESHMPYFKEKYYSYDIDIEKSNLSKEDEEVLRAYAQGIYDADYGLGKLYDFIQKINEPTIIIFLGDHLPYITNSDYKNLIDDLNYFNTSDEKTDLYRKYNTQGLVLSNYDTGDFELPEYIGTDLLLNRIINNMDIKVPNFYKWLNNTYNELPASNKYISVNDKGNIYFTSKLKGSMKNMYLLKEKMQYKFFIKQSK